MDTPFSLLPLCLSLPVCLSACLPAYLSACLSQVFKRHKGVDEDSSPLSEEAMDKSRVELAELERNFLERVAETTSKLKQGGGRGGASGGGSRCSRERPHSVFFGCFVCCCGPLTGSLFQFQYFDQDEMNLSPLSSSLFFSVLLLM